MLLVTTDAEIEAFVRAFEDCSLPRSAWTHQKHLVMALWYLVQLPVGEATKKIRDGIQRYNHSKGNFTGYHETITVAWVSVIERFLAARDRTQSIARLARDLLESCGHKDYLLSFYSREVLLSDDARLRWVPPDRQPIQ
jgi:hypothetical protein